MFLSNIYLSMYLYAWIAVFIIFVLRTKSVGIGGIIILTYVISAIASIIFYNGLEFLNVGEDLSWAPLIYLFSCINICLIPIYVYSKKMSTLKVKLGGSKDSIIDGFILLCSPFLFEAFVEMFIIATSTNADSLNGIYESVKDTVGEQLSFLGRKTMAICRNFHYLWPILFFYQLVKKKKGVYIVAPLIATITGFLEAYASASRVAIVREIMYIFILLMLFKNSLDKKMRKKILKIFIISLCSIVFLLSLITLSRFNKGNQGSNDDILIWVSLYLGEGPIRFCQYMWNIVNFGNGDNVASLFKEIIGLDPIVDMEQRRVVYERITGIPCMIFYTFIGDFFVDFGPILTIGICIIFSMLLYFYLKKCITRGYLYLDSILFLGLMLLMLEFGFMYYTFKVYMVQLLLIPTIMFTIIYRCIK